MRNNNNPDKGTRDKVCNLPPNLRNTIIVIKVGAVHKVRHAPGVGVGEGVTVCDSGSKSM